MEAHSISISGTGRYNVRSRLAKMPKKWGFWTKTPTKIKGPKTKNELFLCKNTTFHFLTFFLIWSWNFDIFYSAIPLILSLFGAKSDVQVSHRRLQKTGTSRRKFWDPKKRSKFQLHPRKKVKKWKVVFLHKNNSFFGFRFLKWILRSK